MFCSNCGKEVSGNYCCYCGNKINNDAKSLQIKNWDEEDSIERIIKHPDVRKIISKYSKNYQYKTSAEDIISIIDAFFINSNSISLNSIKDASLSFYSNLGINKEKAVSKKTTLSKQHVIVKTLCALAHNEYQLIDYNEYPNESIFISRFPSSIWSSGGSIIISIEQSEILKVTIATRIEGQVIDFGRSTAIINCLFDDIIRIKV